MAATTSESLEFTANGGTTSGYLARPAEGGVHPAVVVIQEWWGLNDNIRDIADRIAAEGYVALAPDLYHGNVTAEQKRDFMMSNPAFANIDAVKNDRFVTLEYVEATPGPRNIQAIKTLAEAFWAK